MTHEELVERCHGVAFQATYKDVRAVLAEVLRTLETVTPEMVKAWDGDMTCEEISFPTSLDYASGSWLAMLHASPLAPSVQP